MVSPAQTAFNMFSPCHKLDPISDFLYNSTSLTCSSVWYLSYNYFFFLFLANEFFTCNMVLFIGIKILIFTDNLFEFRRDWWSWTWTYNAASKTWTVRILQCFLIPTPILCVVWNAYNFSMLWSVYNLIILLPQLDPSHSLIWNFPWMKDFWFMVLAYSSQGSNIIYRSFLFHSLCNC